MRSRNRRGANAIEFALTLPIYLSLVLGLADYGYMFHLQAGLDNAVTGACRAGAKIDPNVTSPSGVAYSDLVARSDMFCDGACTLTVNDLSSGSFAVPDRSLECRATRPFTPLIGFAPHPSTLSSVSYQRLEWQRNP